jgi:hypothetical protein
VVAPPATEHTVEQSSDRYPEPSIQKSVKENPGMTQASLSDWIDALDIGHTKRRLLYSIEAEVVQGWIGLQGCA